MLKFRGKWQIPQLGLKFHSQWKTVGPNDVDVDCYVLSFLCASICLKFGLILVMLNSVTSASALALSL